MGYPAPCHPEKLHKAKGLCSGCYTKQRRLNPEIRARDNLAQKLRMKDRPRPIMKTCCINHPEKIVRALGLCGMCYVRKRRSEGKKS